MEFFGGFDEGIEFAFAGFLGGHIVADLYQLLYFCTFPGDKIYLFIVAGAVIEQRLPGDVATTQEFYKDLVFQQPACRGFRLD